MPDEPAMFLGYLSYGTRSSRPLAHTHPLDTSSGTHFSVAIFYTDTVLFETVSCRSYSSTWPHETDSLTRTVPCPTLSQQSRQRGARSPTSGRTWCTVREYCHPRQACRR